MSTLYEWRIEDEQSWTQHRQPMMNKPPLQHPRSSFCAIWCFAIHCNSVYFKWKDKHGLKMWHGLPQLLSQLCPIDCFSLCVTCNELCSYANSMSATIFVSIQLPLHTRPIVLTGSLTSVYIMMFALIIYQMNASFSAFFSICDHLCQNTCKAVLLWMLSDWVCYAFW